MARESSLAALSRLSAPSLGVFRGSVAVGLGVTRNQIAALRRTGAVERVLPDTYRMTSVQRSAEQSLRAALLWAGPGAAAAGRSAGEIYRLEGVAATLPEIVVPRSRHIRASGVIVSRPERAAAMMLRRRRDLPVTGVEHTLVSLACALDDEAFEVACEDARRRRLTSVPALRAYLDRHGRGRPGAVALRLLLDEIDPVYAARSTLEVKTRRLLAANGMTAFVREFPLRWKGQTYRFDFGFEAHRTILETNGRRWHDDAADYERDNEKWSVPGRLGYRIVFATWHKVTRDPIRLPAEIEATLAA